MSSQDRLEHVLRDIHVMVSKSEAYDADRIIVSKKDVFNLIDRLNASVYEIMDEYELTQQSRDRALRENKKEGDKIIWDASRQAVDIYAASVLYTDEALNHLQGIMEYANDTIGKLYKDFGKSMREQQEMIRDNQMELKSQLQLLTDTEKYLNLIEERNREIERERARRKGIKIQETTHKVIKPEIKINEAYFQKAGIALETDEKVAVEEMETVPDEGVITSTLKKVAEDVRQEVLEEANDESTDHDLEAIEPLPAGSIYEGEQEAVLLQNDTKFTETEEVKKKNAIQDNIKVNLNAAYFKQKKDGAVQMNTDAGMGIDDYNESSAEYMEEQYESHHEKTSLLDKLMGKKK